MLLHEDYGTGPVGVVEVDGHDYTVDIEQVGGGLGVDDKTVWGEPWCITV